MPRTGFEIHNEPHRYLVALHGDLDVSTVQPGHEQLLSVDFTAKPWEIDFADVQFLDSAWIQLLISLQRTVQDSHQSFLVRNAHESIRSQFRSVGAEFSLLDESTHASESSPA